MPDSACPFFCLNLSTLALLIEDSSMFRSLSALALLAVPMPVLAQDPSPPAAPPATPKSEMICRTERQTGSMIASKKRCYTRDEWDRLAQGARAMTERMMDDNRSRPGGQ